MKQLNLILLVFLFSISVSAQSKHTISGYVTDSKGESLIGANIVISEILKGVVSNNYGFYSITVPEGNYTVSITYLGYKSKNIPVKLESNKKINIKLEEETAQIENIEIVAEKRDVNIREISMSTEKLDIKTIKKVPSLFGETDIIKVIQLQPGVQTIGEGNSGFFVRGGAVDQNLILLDEAIVYNPAHLMGLFSVFNGDAIKNVTLYKGGIPAKYGGRLSSVLDVRMKEGNQQKISATGGIGAISSRLTLEAPVVKNKSSFIVSGRRTYYDLYFPFFKDSVIQKSSVYFYDLNAKFNYNINENNRVFLSAYTGQDVARFADFFSMQYGNKTATVRWNHIFNSKLFSNYTFIYSNFNYSLGQPTGSFAFTWKSNIIDYSFKNDYTYFLNPNNTINFGLQIIQHNIMPAKFEPSGESNFRGMKLPENFSYESALFMGNEHIISPKLTLSYGLRYSMFNNIGGKIYSFSDDYEVVDTTDYKKGDVFNTYNGLEPRLAARILIDQKSSVKLSYNRTYQYLHLATNTAASTPLDVWFSSNPNIKPQYADQVAGGYFRNFMDNMLEASAEVYYKKMNDAVDFKDHASLIGNELFDAEIRSGSAYSYGLELYLRKKQGKFTGWISYTLSKTRRKIEDVNGGEEYPAPYDRPSDLKIVTSYQILPRINVSANWVFYNALPLTVANQWLKYENMWVPVYSKRNSIRFRGTDYHRLDVAVNYDFRKLFKGVYEHSLTLSVYNVYNRHNIYSLVYEENENGGPPKLMKMYLFGIIPTFTYNFKF